MEAANRRVEGARLGRFTRAADAPTSDRRAWRVERALERSPPCHRRIAHTSRGVGREAGRGSQGTPMHTGTWMCTCTHAVRSCAHERPRRVGIHHALIISPNVLCTQAKGYPLMACTKAAREASGDTLDSKLEAAVEWLSAQGVTPRAPPPPKPDPKPRPSQGVAGAGAAKAHGQAAVSAKKVVNPWEALQGDDDSLSDDSSDSDSD